MAAVICAIPSPEHQQRAPDRPRSSAHKSEAKLNDPARVRIGADRAVPSDRNSTAHGWFVGVGVASRCHYQEGLALLLSGQHALIIARNSFANWNAPTPARRVNEILVYFPATLRTDRPESDGAQ